METIRSKSKMPTNRIVEEYYGKKKHCAADIYEKTDANGKSHYLCRFYAEGEFCYDEFYPNKAIAFAEQAAKFWTRS